MQKPLFSNKILLINSKNEVKFHVSFLFFTYIMIYAFYEIKKGQKIQLIEQHHIQKEAK